MSQHTWSVVIPTIWASSRISDLVSSLELCKYVEEIILIDNRPDDRLEILDCEKLRVLPQERNIFVNPAWNIGVSVARSDLVCVCNDDVNFDPNILEELSGFLKARPVGTVVGCHRDSFSSNSEDMLFEQGHDLGFGWGCVMFCLRESYPTIPMSLRIWSGDRYIVAKARSVYSVRFPIFTEMSVSSGQSVFDDVKHSDKLLIGKLLSRWEKWAVKASERRNGGSKSFFSVVWTILKFQRQKLL